MWISRDFWYFMIFGMFDNFLVSLAKTFKSPRTINNLENIENTLGVAKPQSHNEKRTTEKKENDV